MPTDLTVTTNTARRRYEAVVDQAGTAGFVDYQETDELVVLTHTTVDPAFEGRGVGSTLGQTPLRLRLAATATTRIRRQEPAQQPRLVNLPRCMRSGARFRRTRRRRQCAGPSS